MIEFSKAYIAELERVKKRATQMIKHGTFFLPGNIKYWGYF